VNPSQVMDSTRIETWIEEGFDSGVVGAVHLEAAKHSNSSFNLLFLDGEEVVPNTIQLME
jgi:prepilin-type processing-associated H-X9-DG protein